MNQGIHNIPAGLYHADPCDAPSLSNSIMKVLLGKSPRHAKLKHPRLTPSAPEDEVAEPKFDLGSAAHSLLLEGIDKVAVIYADDWRKKETKAERENARAQGFIPMLERQYNEARAMVEVAKSYIQSSSLGNILGDGDPEQSVIWFEGEHRIWCRAMTDWLTTDRSIILDYKTTAMGSPGAFCRSSMTAFGYDTQDVFYRRGVRKITDIDPDFYFLVQEDEAPFECYLVQPAPSMRAVAEHKVERAMALWAKCLREDDWPGYPGFVHYAEAAAWAVAEEEGHG